jgi:mRNA interferase MazF
MPPAAYSQDEVLLAWLVFSDGQGSKRRPVLVIHDFGDADLLVVPITSQPARVPTDVILSDWKGAGLKLPSTIRLEKLATIEKSCVVRKLGALALADLASVRKVLTNMFGTILK